MIRPRWHDGMIAIAIVALLLTGVWALWWDDVREALGWKTSSPDAKSAPTGPGAPRTPGPSPST